MPLKYLGGMPNAVKVVGSAHGALWILYLLALASAWLSERWPFRVAVYGFIASVLPLGPIFFDRWLHREYAPDAA
jgi:integral membrane protein